MIYHRRQGWEIKESAATPEAAFMNRRAFLAKAGLGAAALSALPRSAIADSINNDIAADLYPAKRNPRYMAERPLTKESISAAYNNFYEFGSHKRIARAAQALSVSPWSIRLDGEVAKPLTIDIEQAIRRIGIEERIYRHRCVEAWAMTVPWSGFPLRKLVQLAEPTSSARYLVFETFLDPAIAPGQRQIWYPWPYREGITMAEAMNDLSFMAVGVYGHPLQKQFGAPVRLALPWKYGFKSIKSITRIHFVKARPKSFWERINSREYGFWANVNPDMPHPRWSQASEELIGEGRRVATRLFNGYGEFVAALYQGMENEPLWR